MTPSKLHLSSGIRQLSMKIGQIKLSFPGLTPIFMNLAIRYRADSVRIVWRNRAVSSKGAADDV
jgi:hypothetical protein